MKNSNVSNISNLKSPKSPYKMKKTGKSPKFLKQKTSPNINVKKLNFSVMSNKDESSEEYIKCLKVALKHALDENEQLRELELKLVNKKNKLVDEVDQKNDA